MFDSSAARVRVSKLWELEGHFGFERGSTPVFLDEIVSDRMQLVAGLQILRDELYFSRPPASADRESCSADFSLPSVVTTLAYTNCGDRIHQDEIGHYQQVVASRFATVSEVGSLKPEAFHPTGGGTDNGATLAHVTWAHVLDEPLRKRVYDGNAKSFVMCAFDLKTHCGRLEAEKGPVYGSTSESSWREPRAACGAIVGALAKYDDSNDVHRRLRSNLGEENFQFLAAKGVRTKDGVDITAAVAGAIVSIQGMRDTAKALMHEMDERGVAHLTASMTINRPAMRDTILYLARATVFGGELVMQGFGVDARKYTGEMVSWKGDTRLKLAYDGIDGAKLPITRESYHVRDSVLPGDLFV